VLDYINCFVGVGRGWLENLA